MRLQHADQWISNDGQYLKERIIQAEHPRARKEGSWCCDMSCREMHAAGKIILHVVVLVVVFIQDEFVIGLVQHGSIK
jgi:hypothetical protein